MIYLDNAASTHKKPQSVVKAMNSYMQKYASNSGRSGHKLSLYSGEKIYECRELIARLFNIDNPALIAFTPNTTAALNLAIHGYITPKDHVVIGGMEHNSVVRPVVASGAAYSVARADNTGLVTAESVRAEIKYNTKLIIINHASNIVGTINPINEIGRLAAEKNIPLLVDAAQTAGVVNIDVVKDNVAMLAFAGHKMLYGPTGTGGLYVREDIKLKPLLQGGTGTLSESIYQPDFMPDCLESGTPNIVGIIGLSEGVRYVLNNGTDTLFNYEHTLSQYLKTELSKLNNVNVYGNKNSVGVVGFNINGMDSVSVSNLLDSRYNIASRGGLHCAILAHQSMGTEKTGLVRLSVSSFTTEAEVRKAVTAIKEICLGGDAYYKDFY